MKTDAIVYANRIDRVIQVLCPLIDERVKGDRCIAWTEIDLRKELLGCILGSQVRYEMAQAAVERIERAGMLSDVWWHANSADHEPDLYAVLSGKGGAVTQSSGYRFPRVRAQQLSLAMQRLSHSGRSLNGLVFCSGEANVLRCNLISMIPGLGPKQASMFLRNIGRSYDLAVLDNHVLRFMEIKHLLPGCTRSFGSLSAYERAESIIRSYAESLGYPVGYLDWAIWATMRAARELRLWP